MHSRRHFPWELDYRREALTIETLRAIVRAERSAGLMDEFMRRARASTHPAARGQYAREARQINRAFRTAYRRAVDGLSGPGLLTGEAPTTTTSERS